MSEKSTLTSLTEFDFESIALTEKIKFLQAVGLILKNSALDKKLKIDEFLSSMGVDVSQPEVKDSGFVEVYSSIFNLEEIISLAAMANAPMHELIDASRSNPNMSVAQAFVETMKKGA